MQFNQLLKKIFPLPTKPVHSLGGSVLEGELSLSCHLLWSPDLRKLCLHNSIQKSLMVLDPASV